MEVVWRIMCDYLFFIHHAFGVEICSFVLMGNHYHLLARFPEANLAQAMQYFARETSRSIAYASHRTNHVYGGPYFRSRIGTHRYLMCAYKYFYRNPVEAGLSRTVEDYRYSTLRSLLGLDRGWVPLIEDEILMQPDFDRTLAWLNRTTNPSYRDDVRKALRRAQFALPPSVDRHAHPLEIEDY